MHHADRNAHADLIATARALQPAPRPAAPAVNPNPTTLADALRWIAAGSVALLALGLFV